MHDHIRCLHLLTRRHFLQQSQLGMGAIALSSLLARDGDATPLSSVVNPLSPKQPPFPAKAKQVIYLHMTGSPPNLDLWDYKPELVKRDGQDCPDAYLAGRRFAFTTGVPKLLGTPRKFGQHGEGGQWMSDALPHLHEVADELCTVHSINSITRPPSSCFTRAHPAPAARRWGPGSRMASDRKTKTFPATSC
jgi:uncharacterized protein DUF1501